MGSIPGDLVKLHSLVSILSSEDSAIRCEQLDLLQDWLADFRKSTSSTSTANPEELVVFDIICGDLNFDNCSSDDKLEQQHSLFTRYKDPCRLGPGEEKPWAIGKQGAGLTMGCKEAPKVLISNPSMEAALEAG